MKLYVAKDAEALGAAAAKQAARILNEAIAERGCARIVLSTGASQFTTLQNLVRADVDFAKVEMFHLDEYVGLPDTHPASFRKYLRERFIDLARPGRAHLVGDEPMGEIARALRSAPIDLGLVGIGVNGHIAFNDPPADVTTREAYITVNLDPTCRMQQVGEGWFSGADEVPKQAISMTVYQILRCEKIISCVPYAVKADAVRKTLETPETNLVPATYLKAHPDWTLYADEESFAGTNPDKIGVLPIRI